MCHTGLLTASEQDQDGTSSVLILLAVWHTPLPCVQWKTPDDGQRNCPKYADFYSKNKFEKLVYLVGFIIRRASILSRDYTTCLVYKFMQLLVTNRTLGLSLHRPLFQYLFQYLLFSEDQNHVNLHYITLCSSFCIFS